jgi:hypothetical protein
VLLLDPHRLLSCLEELRRGGLQLVALLQPRLRRRLAALGELGLEILRLRP